MRRGSRVMGFPRRPGRRRAASGGAIGTGVTRPFSRATWPDSSCPASWGRITIHTTCLWRRCMPSGRPRHTTRRPPPFGRAGLYRPPWTRSVEICRWACAITSTASPPRLRSGSIFFLGRVGGWFLRRLCAYWPAAAGGPGRRRATSPAPSCLRRASLAGPGRGATPWLRRGTAGARFSTTSSRRSRARSPSLRPWGRSTTAAWCTSRRGLSTRRCSRSCSRSTTSMRCRCAGCGLNFSVASRSLTGRA